jgi:DNA (cytosine-5)-methyltransferase 1
MKPRALDLFCCAGGAGMGLHRAGFDVVGVDIKPQPLYPFEFHQADALSYPLDGFDFIWASPPCQKHSAISRVSGRQRHHVDHIDETRQHLVRAGVPYVIENVIGAPLIDPFMLCGTMFGLQTSCGAELQRHRIFEANWNVGLVPQCQHGKTTRLNRRKTITVTGSTPQQNVATNKVRLTFSADEARRAMGIDWMPMRSLSQAIPPAYSEFIGKAAMKHIQAKREAA